MRMNDALVRTSDALVRTSASFVLMKAVMTGLAQGTAFLPLKGKAPPLGEAYSVFALYL